ncbi:hypothetical protein Tco_0860378 [Tanacetum coccineum]|uniref:MAK10-like protein n=1 Tax=Tanacetum coccineum TaxID=301880 RepID=A0ABQ5BI80_9ASTR
MENLYAKRTIDQSAGGKLRDLNIEESWALLEDLALYDNESWNDPRDFYKLVKSIALPQDVPSTSDRHLIELENQYCMEDPEQAFVEYTSSRTDEAGGKWLSKFEANFKRQQGEMTNKIDTVLKAIIDQIAGTLPSDTVKNQKLSTSPVLSAHSYPTEDPQCSTHVHGSINAISIHPKQPKGPQVRKLNLMLESLRLAPQSSNTKFTCSKYDDGEVMFIKIIRDNDEPQNEGPNEGKGAITEGPAVEYFDTFPSRDELRYHKENANGGVSNFIGRIEGMHVFVGNFIYIMDFMIIEDISSIIDPRLSQVVLGKHFMEISNMTHDPPDEVVRFTNENNEVSYKMPYKIEPYDSLSDLEKEHTKSVYLRNEEDKRKGMEYVMSKILGFYKECLELRPEYLT